MSFAGPAEFFSMGGHGLYVWMSYAAALIIVLYNVFSARLRQRRALREVGARLRRENAAGRPVSDAKATGESIRQ